MIINYSTKQRGYGRQSLYIDTETQKNIYVQDVFPNVEEHFGIVLSEDAFYIDNCDCYIDHNYNPIDPNMIFDSVVDALNKLIDVNDFIDEI